MATVLRSPAAHAGTLLYGPDTCADGYVWREAGTGGHVCVTPETRAQVANDNVEAASRVRPAPIVAPEIQAAWTAQHSAAAYYPDTLYASGRYFSPSGIGRSAVTIHVRHHGNGPDCASGIVLPDITPGGHANGTFLDVGVVVGGCTNDYPTLPLVVVAQDLVTGTYANALTIYPPAYL